MERKYKIIRNALQCKICGEVIESKTVHDFVGCKCFRDSNGKDGIFVDGGTSYLRWGGNPNDWINLSETRKYTDKERDEYNMAQIDMYKKYGWKPDLME